jgi:hypothetical protein
MLKQQWIMPVFAICGLVSGCGHHATTLTENDPFHGKDPFQEVAAQNNTASDNSGVASVNVTPPPASTRWNTPDGWRSNSHNTHPEFNDEPAPSMSNPQLARVAISDHTYSSSQKPGSAIQNAEYVVAKPVSAEARIQIVSADEDEAQPHPKITVHDGLRFIETSKDAQEGLEFAEQTPKSILSREIPPFIEESAEPGERNPFEANPFEANPARKPFPERTATQNSPEWWNE